MLYIGLRYIGELYVDELYIVELYIVELYIGEYIKKDRSFLPEAPIFFGCLR